MAIRLFSLIGRQTGPEDRMGSYILNPIVNSRSFCIDCNYLANRPPLKIKTPSFTIGMYPDSRASINLFKLEAVYGQFFGEKTPPKNAHLKHPSTTV